MYRQIIDTCQRKESKLVCFLRDNLLKGKCNSEEVYCELFLWGSTPVILYGLPKVHKETSPVRPILSAIGIYNYKLAKFLVPPLKPYTCNQ